MLGELLRSFRLRTPPWARRLGLAHEHVAITFRRRRVGGAWASHLAASKAAILDAADRCAAHRRALVIGAGDCADVPVEELAERFESVVLTDVVLGPEIRRFAHRSGGRIRAEIWDATGALPTLARERQPSTADRIAAVFAAADPGAAPGGEPDLVVSANCISQLGAVPLDRIRGVRHDDAALERGAAAAAKRHLRWLAERSGVRVLLGDVARLDVTADGTELHREPVPGMNELRPPDRTWRWTIAPIPEFSRAFHRVHEVGVWIDPPASGR